MLFNLITSLVLFSTVKLYSGSNVKIMGPCVIHKMKPHQNLTNVEGGELEPLSKRCFNISNHFEVHDWNANIWKVTFNNQIGKCELCFVGVERLTDWGGKTFDYRSNDTTCLSVKKKSDYAFLKFETFKTLE